jgi:hypothetical protein
MMIGVVIDVFSKEHNANSRENGEGEAYQVQEIYKMVSEMKVDIKELSQHSKSYIK